MGAWGIGPTDNDTALDFVGTLTSGNNGKTFWETIQNAFEQGSPEEIRAAAQATIGMLAAIPASAPFEFNVTELAVKALNKVTSDTDWMLGWEEADRAEVRKSIKSQINVLSKAKTTTTLMDTIATFTRLNKTNGGR